MAHLIRDAAERFRASCPTGHREPVHRKARVRTACCNHKWVRASVEVASAAAFAVALAAAFASAVSADAASGDSADVRAGDAAVGFDNTVVAVAHAAVTAGVAGVRAPARAVAALLDAVAAVHLRAYLLACS
jgi:hypothetical protein